MINVVLRRYHQSEIRQEAKGDFRIEFENGSSATLCLANPGSSVAVRDINNAVEYLG